MTILAYPLWSLATCKLDIIIKYNKFCSIHILYMFEVWYHNILVSIWRNHNALVRECVNCCYTTSLLLSSNNYLNVLNHKNIPIDM